MYPDPQQQRVVLRSPFFSSWAAWASGCISLTLQKAARNDKGWGKEWVVEGGRAWLWNPHFICQLWGLCTAAWMGKLTSSGYITVQRLDGN